MSRPKKISDADVLNLAFDVIAREGFQSFTFEQVAKAVGLSPAALVKRFKTKKKLAFLARNQRWERNIGQIPPRVLDDLKGMRGLWEFLTLIAKSVNSKRLGEHAIWLGTEACHPASKKKVSEYFEATRGIFRRLLQEAMDSGELSKSVNPKRLANTLEALVQGAIFQFAFLNGWDIETHLRSHIMVFLEPHLTTNETFPPRANVRCALK